MGMFECCKKTCASLRRHPHTAFLLGYLMLERCACFMIYVTTFLYLKHELRFSLPTAIGTTHLLLSLGYMTPWMGSYMADTCMGRYLALIVFSLFSLLSLVIVTAASLAPTILKLKSAESYMAVSGLAMFWTTTGLRRVVNWAFSGDQFELPYYEYDFRRYQQLEHYLTILGALIGVVLAPLLRMHMFCNDDVYCFPMTFGVAAAILLLAILFLAIGGNNLVVQPGGAHHCVFTEAVVCVYHAWKHCGEISSHWLDRANCTFRQDFIDDMKRLCHVIPLFWPLVIFWALHEQQVTWFVYQATRLVWTLDKEGIWAVEPDQMLWVSMVTLMLCVPLVEWLLYPLLTRCRWMFLNTIPRRAVLGAILAAVAFGLAAHLQLRLEPFWEDLPVKGSGKGELIILSTMWGDRLNLTTDIKKYKIVDIGTGYQAYRLKNIPVNVTRETLIGLQNSKGGGLGEVNASIRLVEGKTVGILGPFQSNHSDIPDDLPVQRLWRCDLQLPRMGIIYMILADERVHNLTDKDENSTFFENPTPPSFSIDIFELNRRDDIRSIFLNPFHFGQHPRHFRPTKHLTYATLLPEKRQRARYRNRLDMERGGVYLFFNIWRDDGVAMTGSPDDTGGYRRNLSVVFPPNYIHMSRQVPSYLLMALAHYMLALCILEYAFSQIPPRMKPVALIVWYWTAALGNLLVCVFVWPGFIVRDFWVYMLFCVLMAVDVFWVVMVTVRHTPWSYLEDDDDVTDHVTRRTKSARSRGGMRSGPY